MNFKNKHSGFISLTLGFVAITGLPLMAEARALPWEDESANSSPEHLTLAVKYVSYSDGEGKNIMNSEKTRELFSKINELYSSCDMHFRVDEFLEANPRDFGLDFYPSRMSDLNRIRTQFEAPDQLVVINTGEWDSSGGLGADGANAWTMLPGENPPGAVIEDFVANNSNLVAHELGHYLGLSHANNPSNLMNPVIYESSSQITPQQCETMREAATESWPAALRTSS